MHLLTDKYKILITGYSTGEISENERIKFEDHLKICAKCRKEVERVSVAAADI
ncbi:MAG: zf-HC2 domain-containing protein, partial [Actinomycetia bacterium]|nr:zf-HC2 domain-containing protein [Actinomycetes bacterium]